MVAETGKAIGVYTSDGYTNQTDDSSVNHGVIDVPGLKQAISEMINSFSPTGQPTTANLMATPMTQPIYYGSANLTESNDQANGYANKTPTPANLAATPKTQPTTDQPTTNSPTAQPSAKPSATPTKPGKSNAQK